MQKPSSYNIQKMIQKITNTQSSRQVKIMRKTLKMMETIQKIPFFHHFIVSVEILLLISLIVRLNISQLSSLRTTLDSLAGRSSATHIFIWIFGGLQSILVLCLTLEAILKQNFSFTEWVTSIFYIVLQSTSLFYFLNMAAMFESTPIFSVILLFSVFLPLNALLFFLQPEAHLLGVASIPIIILEPFVPSNVWRILLMIVLVGSLEKSSTIFQKFGSLVVFLTQIWSFCHPIQDQNSSSSLINLLLIYMISFLLTYFLEDRIAEEDCSCYLLKAIQNKKQIDSTQIIFKMKQKVLILEKLVSKLLEMDDSDLRDKLVGFQQSLLDNKVTRESILDMLMIIAEKKDQKWLKAQVEILRNKSPFKIYQSIGQIVPNGLFQALQLEKMKLEAERTINSNRQGKNVDVRLVIEVTNHIQRFHQYAYLSLCQLARFWTASSQEVIQIKTINEIFGNVLEEQQKAKECLSMIKNAQFCRKQAVLYHSIEAISNNYQGEPFEQASIKSNVDEGKSDYDYIILSGQEIDEISSKLMIELNMENNKKFLKDCSEIFPSKVIDTILKVHSKKGSEFVIPLLQKDRIILKNASIHLLPSYDSKVKYIMVLHNRKPGFFFLYDLNQDQILYYSKNLCENTFEEPSLSHLPQELLNMSFTSQVIEQLRKGGHLGCELKNKLKQGEICRATLSLLESYENQNSSLLLLEINMTACEQKIKLRAARSLKNTQVDSTRSSKMTILNVQNQQVFCRIKNPYGDNIVQKLENMSKNNTPSLAFWVCIIFSLIITTVIVFFISIQQFSNKRTSMYITYLKEGSSLNDEYQYLLSVFYDSHIRYFVKTESDKLLAFNPNLNITAILNDYTSSINTKIGSIMEQQLWNPLKQYQYDMNYTLKYDLFNVSASIKKKDIMVLLNQIKRYLNTYDISFLTQNYNEIRDIEGAFKISSVVADSFDEFPTGPAIFTYVAFIILVILVVLIYIIIIKTKDTFSAIYAYLSKLKPLENKQQFERILNILKEPMLQYYDSKHDKKCLHEITLSVRNLNQKAWKEEQKERKVHLQGFFRTIAKNSIFLVLIAVFSIGGIYQKMLVYGQIDSFTQIVNYIQRFQISSDFVLTQMTDALNAASWKTLYNETNIYGLSNEIAFKTQLKNDNLPSFFDSFRELHLKNLYKDLCLEKDLVDDIRIFQGVNCQQVYDGSLVRGFSIVYQNYRSSLTHMQTASLENLLEIYRSDKALYPIFIEASFARRLITRFIDQLTIEFKNTSEQYSYYLNTIIVEFVIIGYLLMTLAIILVSHTIWAFKKECQLVLSILKAVPKSTLLKIKYSKEMIRTNFLASLQRL